MKTNLKNVYIDKEVEKQVQIFNNKKYINKNQTTFDKKFQEVNFFLKNDLLFSLDQPIFIRFFKYLSLNNYLLKKTW